MTASSARALVDANLLVYCYDRADPVKQQRALETVDALAATGTGALSTQVLGEFFLNVTRKLAEPLSLEDAEGRIEHYLRVWTVLDVTARVVREAVRGVRAHGFHYWDAQIWAVARLHGIPLVLSEDFNDGAVLDGVRFRNPLRPGFRLPEWR